VKGLTPLFLGLFGTFAFSWLGLTVIPNMQIGALNPQADEEGTDIYPMPKSGMAEHGRRVYTANGCVYCHSQQLRPDYASADIDRKWGERRSAPRDYIFETPVLLGQERLGPDLSNVGKRGAAEEKPAASPAPAANAPGAPQAPAPAPNAAPQKPPAAPNAPAQNQPAAPPANAAQQKPPAAAASPAAPSAAAQNPPAPAASAAPSPSATPNPNGMPAMYSEAWHHRHLYSPRSISPDNIDSVMPAYRFLYEKRQISSERSSDALQLSGADAPPAGWEIVPTYDAKCLVAYLMSLDQSHPLKEVKGGGGGAAPAPAGSPAAPAAAQPAAPPKK
jgi:cbb3-type cytochrome oxidase cytochrome c subunit